ncbi:MAG: hypothetical protein ACI8ZO_001346 [Flavobacteriales bacterium]|jgi:hypothetical protein
MKQYKRILYFILGVGLGTLLTFLIFGNRDIVFNYLPNSRVVNFLTNYPLEYTSLAECQKNCLEYDSLAIVSFIRSGEVDFSKSTARPDTGVCKTYWIDGLMYGEETSVLIETCDTIGLVYKFIPAVRDNCACN